MKPLYCTILFCSFLCCTSFGQKKITTKTLTKIDRLFEKIKAETPGYIVGVIQDTSYLIEKSYGSANLDYNIPISSTSAFNIASLSKQFTAACVALLMLEDKVSFEDPIRKFMPDFPKYEQELQIKHLIYMTSGINDYYYNTRPNGMDWSSLQFFNIDTAIMASLSNEALMYAPGTQWSYSNINYMLLTKVVEQVSGMRFSEFAKKRLFEPLGMYNTLVHDDLFQVVPNRVLGYNYRDADNTNWMLENGYLPEQGEGFLQINRTSPHYGGSGIYSTLEDLKKWVINFQSKSFGGQAFYDLMHTTMPFEHTKTNDALGLVFGDFNGHEIIWYEGGDWGFSNYMMRFPKNNLTVIVLSNLGSGNARQFANRITDILVEDRIVKLK